MGRAILFAALACAGCYAEGSLEVQSQLARLEQESMDGVAQVERALADPTFRSLGEGVRNVETSIRKLGAIEADPTASDAQRFQAMMIGARAWDDLAGAFERAAAEGAPGTQTLLDKATPARFLATTGYARAYEFACSQGLTDHPLFVENSAVCTE